MKEYTGKRPPECWAAIVGTLLLLSDMRIEGLLGGSCISYKWGLYVG